MDFMENSKRTLRPRNIDDSSFGVGERLIVKGADPSFRKPALTPVCGINSLYAKNLTQHIGGTKIYLKQEGLNTGPKVNNALGQVLLAKHCG